MKSRGKRDKTKVNTVLGAKCEGKRLCGKQRHLCEDNIKINVKEIRWQCMGEDSSGF
jgi:hypothetical protein